MARTPSGGGSSILPSNSTSYLDSTWDYDTSYTYQLKGRISGYIFDEATQTYKGYDDEWTAPICRITVRKITANKAQTVDTRIDPRYITYQLKNFKFGNGLRRGGLFAGYNADSSNVARTYLQFNNLTGPASSSDQIWAIGGVYLYSPRNATSGTTAMLKARFVANDSWDPATLVWANAPSFATSGVDAISIFWATGDPGKWVNLNIVPDIENSLVSNGGDGTLSVAILATGETNGGTSATFPLQASNGWSYFARAGYSEPGKPELAPYVIYAFGGLGAGVNAVSVNSGLPVHSSSSFNGTVTLSSPAPSGGVTVTLSSSNAAKLSVPSSVTIPAGQASTTFTSTSGTITTSDTVTVSATLGKTVTTTVNLAP